ncbi:MAG: hypothetical protein RQ756_07635 [Flavobacteriaceae bacterium]|nr:hypothetical protein [Flavobacteriaceae bacterium]
MKTTIFKPFAFLFMAAVLFTACSDDDDNTSPQNGENPTFEEQFIGLWTLESRADETGMEVLDDCEKQTKYLLKTDASFDFELVDLNDDETGCESIFQISGQWEVLGTTQVRLVIPGLNTDADASFQDITGNTFLTLEFDNGGGTFVRETYRKN